MFELSGFGSIRGVVGEMTFLTKRRKVQESGGLGSFVEDVGGGEDDFRACDRVGLPVRGSAKLATASTPIDPDEPGSGFPVGRVAGSILGTDRHESASLHFLADSRCAGER